MTDGEWWKGVAIPEGSKPKEMGWGEYLDNIGRKVAAGISLGWADEAAAGMDALTQPVLGRGSDAPSMSERYSQNLGKEQQRDKGFEAEYPKAALASEIGGNVAGALTLPTKMFSAATVPAQMLKGVGSGAAIGGVAGAGAADPGKRIEGAISGAEVGGAVGGLAPAAVWGGQKVASRVLDFVGLRNADKGAVQQLLRAFERDGVDPNEALKRYQAWQQAGSKPEVLADLGGENVRNLAAVAANTPSNARQAAMDLVEQRKLGAPERVGADVQRSVSPTADYTGTADDLLRTRSQSARPLYEEAFQGGSTAPLRTQLEDAFGAAVNAERQAQQAVAAAEQTLTMARAETSRAGNNVYANAGALPNERAAQQALEAAKKQAEMATSGKQAILDRLRIAQDDATSNAPGAVWSPRVQQFIDDPVSREGLARGMRIQRLEALAEGRPFNPMELAITGLDEAGNPLVSQVPNLRTLDAIKRGLDDRINSARDATTGRINWTEELRAVDQVRRSLINELDRLTGGAEGAYAKARRAYSGPSQSLEALALGRSILRGDADVTAKKIADMDPGDREFLRIGVAKAIQDAVENTADGRNIVASFFNKPALRNKLEAAFETPKQFQAFESAMKREMDMASVNNAINPRGGSQTFRLQEGSADTGVDPISAFSNLLQGNLKGAATSMLPSLKGNQRMNSATADALSPLLFETDPAQVQATLQRLGNAGPQYPAITDTRQALARALMGPVPAMQAGDTAAPRRPLVIDVRPSDARR